MSNAEALAATNSEAAVGELTAGRSEIKGTLAIRVRSFNDMDQTTTNES